MSLLTSSADEPADKSIVILQSLICLLRERNILSRADIEELCEKVQARAAQHELDPIPCRDREATEAATIISSLSDYIGRRYGGKHRRY
ncbi:hypothetical protein HL653_23785 [Sphingomonas sp. AP4-R1]|uniref:hypothetical protein n=1 Tax=Sphingomonas sp. AP4-R1 TaxID=2735134 RepID=UPI00149373DC|nr:hypothetical protein [Sphingomonas sp. AP4-R1]QJU60350.1 hypothetical protein HL653_23785 [Sphingomonas sp. AP4-R1]